MTSRPPAHPTAASSSSLPARRRRGDGDSERGSVMPLAIVFIAALLVGVDALVSASQRWVVRRRVVAVAAAAARAGAQGDAEVLRVGGVLDTDAATARAGELLGVAHMTGTVSVDPIAGVVTVTVTAPVGYAFASPGFPATVTGTATAGAHRGVSGQEGG